MCGDVVTTIDNMMVNTIKWKVVLLAKLFQLSHREFEDP